MFDNEDAAIGYLRDLYPHFNGDEFRALVDLLCQDHAEEADTIEGWWELSEDEMREWAEEIVATSNF